MSRPLTILHLTHDGVGAGSSISIALLARAQRDAGHRVIVACPEGRWLQGLLAGSGVAFAPVAFDSRRAAARTIERLVAGERVQVVNAHSSRDRSATRRLRMAGRLKAALVMTRRAMPMSSPVSALLSGFAADRTIAVSEPVRRALVRRGTPPWRVRVVRNALDVERVDQPCTQPMIDRAADTIRAGLGNGRSGFAGLPLVGVVSRPKDHGTLLAAMARLRTRAALVSLGFADAGLRFPVPESRCPAVFLPFQDNPFPFYRLFDVVVLPTRHEGLSQGLMEAMALGKAIVTSRSGGNTDLIDDGVHGLLVPPGDAGAMAAAIGRLLDDGALRARLGSAARDRARGEFTIARTAAATEAVYREALERR